MDKLTTGIRHNCFLQELANQFARDILKTTYGSSMYKVVRNNYLDALAPIVSKRLRVCPLCEGEKRFLQIVGEGKHQITERADCPICEGKGIVLEEN